MKESAVTARRMWTLFEPVHVVTYFAPEARQAFEDAGLRGFWRGYFAGRAAPAGPVDAPLVIAMFGSFAPSFVRRALPAVWELITPSEALRVREAGAVAAIGALMGGQAGHADHAGQAGQDQEAGRGVLGLVRAAADLLVAATEDVDTAGRPLGGPNAALAVPAEPFARLWWAATVLREHRGDGHIAALVAAGIDGCEALVLRTAVDAADGAGAGAAGSLALARSRMQSVRGWSDEAWDKAANRLRDRGWLNSEGTATAAGLAAHRSVEDATDRASDRPWARLGSARTGELAESLVPVASACAAVLPYPNPVGVPRPALH